MNILIAARNMKYLAGSELYAKDLALGLKERGHQVLVYGERRGIVSDEISKKGIKVFSDFRKIQNINFDVIHVQQNTILIKVRAYFPNIPIVFMIHGMVSGYDHLPFFETGVYRYLCVCERIRSFFSAKNKISKDFFVVIRNFVDVERFRSYKKVNERPEKLLVLSNHYLPEMKKTIESVCREMKISVEHVGLPENHQAEVERFINKADIVVTLGRGALEAMACERNVIIYGWNGGNGMVNEDNFFELRKTNFSGRSGKNHKQFFSAEDFREEVKKYRPDLGPKLRQLVLMGNSADRVLKELESVYESAVRSQEEIKFNKLLNKKTFWFFVLVMEIYNKGLIIKRSLKRLWQVLVFKLCSENSIGLKYDRR